MTEKTPKTPQSESNSSVANDKTAVSEPKGRDKPSDESTEKAALNDPGVPAAQKTPVQTPAGATAVKKDVTAKSDAPAKNETARKAGASAGMAGSVPPPAGGGAGGKGTPPSDGAARPSKKSSSLPIVVLLVAVLLLAGAMAYQYSRSQQELARLESQSRSSADQARQAEQKAQQALDMLNQQRDAVSALRAEIRESRAELDGLNSAFQTITDRGSDLVLLNDIDHLVMIAQQQLQLNGNVANAIISLETAQAQLARANRPALASLQQTINGDLDRLRATSTVDIALLSARLDELAGLVSQSPMLIPDGVVPAAERPARESSDMSRLGGGSSPDSDSDVWWEKALSDTWQWTTNTVDSLRHELGQFISVRRVDDASALLISPDQATRFRESLRQRIMTAQLALMMDQSLIWETETDALLKAIESRFDSESSVTRQAIRIAREVADTSIDTPLPDVSNSIKALEAIHEQMGRRAAEEPSAGDDPSPIDANVGDVAPEGSVDDVQGQTGNGADDADASGFVDDADVEQG